MMRECREIRRERNQKTKRKSFNGAKVSSRPQPAPSHNVWNTGADTTGYLAVFTWRTHCRAHYRSYTALSLLPHSPRDRVYI